MNRLRWHTARWLVGLAVLGLVLWRTGIDPFVAGVRSLDLWTLAVGAALAVPVTVACAWRWRLVARRLGVGIDLGPAVASCYRAQFLNAVLPGGVLGDVHRGLRHGRAAGDTGRALRAVVWERTAGQAVQALLAVAVLLFLPSPVRSSAPLVLGVLGVLAAAAAVLLRLRTRVPSWSSPVGRMLRAVREDLAGLLDRRVWPGLVLASTVAVVGYVATYLLAARAVGVTAGVGTLLPLALLVLAAAGLPTNVAGWGPREGVAAWTFAAAGLGAEQGVATAVAYGAIVTVASLPGAVVLLGRAPARTRPPAPVPVALDAVPRRGAGHG